MHIYTAPRVTLLSKPDFTAPLHVPVKWLGDATPGERLAEFAGRSCYQSFENPAHRATAEYLENILKQAHGSVLEHANYSVYIEGVSRSLTHELVRHRAGFAYSQLSQRYVDESDVGFVVPPAVLDAGEHSEEYRVWRDSVSCARDDYRDLSDRLFTEYEHITDRVLRRKTAREAARGVLPNSTETKLVVTGNARAWRTMLELRGSEHADREIRRLACEVFAHLDHAAPAFFADFEYYTGADDQLALRPRYHKV